MLVIVPIDAVGLIAPFSALIAIAKAKQLQAIKSFRGPPNEMRLVPQLSGAILIFPNVSLKQFVALDDEVMSSVYEAL